jgi:Tfp pilus assembly ATPase PilU
MIAVESKNIAYYLMNEHQIRLFDTNLNIGLGVSIPQLGRFRVSVVSVEETIMHADLKHNIEVYIWLDSNTANLNGD